MPGQRRWFVGLHSRSNVSVHAVERRVRASAGRTETRAGETSARAAAAYDERFARAHRRAPSWPEKCGPRTSGSHAGTSLRAGRCARCGRRALVAPCRGHRFFHERNDAHQRCRLAACARWRVTIAARSPFWFRPSARRRPMNSEHLWDGDGPEIDAPRASIRSAAAQPNFPADIKAAINVANLAYFYRLSRSARHELSAICRRAGRCI